MNRKKWRVFGTIILLLAAIFPIPWIAIRYQSQINFVPESFLAEYLKFMGSLVAIFMAFLLVDVFWASEKGLKQAGQIRKVFIFRLETIIKLTSSTKVELEPKSTKVDALKAEEKAIKNLQNLGIAQDEVAKILYDHGIAIAEDKNLETELFTFIGSISPVIRDLGAFDSIRPDLVKIIEKLAFIEIHVGEMLKRLKGRQG